MQSAGQNAKVVVVCGVSADLGGVTVREVAKRSPAPGPIARGTAGLDPPIR